MIPTGYMLRVQGKKTQILISLFLISDHVHFCIGFAAYWAEPG